MSQTPDLDKLFDSQPASVPPPARPDSRTLDLRLARWTTPDGRALGAEALAVLPVAVAGALGCWGALAGSATLGVLGLLSGAAAAALHWRSARAAQRDRVQLQRQVDAGRDVTARWAALQGLATDGVLVLDAMGQILEVNAAAATLLGRHPQDLLGLLLGELLAPEDAPPVSTDPLAVRTPAPTPEALAGGKPLVALRAGGPRPALTLHLAEVAHGPTRRCVGLLRNHAPLLALQREADAAARALRQADAQRHALLAQSPLAMVQTDARGRIEALNPAAERLLGCIASVERGNALADTFFDGPDRDALLQAMVDLQSGLGAVQERQLHGVRRDGRRVPLSTVLAVQHDDLGRLSGLWLFAQDIGERLRLAEQLSHLAFHDPLTQLPNRRQLEQRLQQGIAHSRRSGAPLALLLLDLDGFKPVNDACGHAVGDALLVEVAQRLRKALRDIDFVARLGDDEFVVLFGALSRLDDAPVVADKLLATLAEPMLLLGHRLQVQASIGVATYPDAGDDAQALLRAASAAMTDAKLARRATLKRLGLPN